MRIVRLPRLAAIALSLVAIALPHGSAPRPAFAAGSGVMNEQEAAYAAELTRLTLQERQARNLIPLGEHAALTRAAILFAQYLAQPGVPFSHTADGSMPAQRAIAQGYGVGAYFATSGENIALNQPTPAVCFATLMSSAGHRDNIITDMPVPTPSRRHLAVGVCIANGKTIAVQMFGIQQFLGNPTPTPTPTPRPTPTPLPTPRVATLSIAAGRPGTLTVVVPAAPRARTLTVSVTGSPIVAPVTTGVAAKQARTVVLNITASTAARTATARTTDGSAAPSLTFTPRTVPGPTPTPTPRPQAQVVTLSVPANAARNLVVSVPAFARARSLGISVSGVPQVRPVLLSLPANTSRTVTVGIPAARTVRSVVVRVSDGPRPTVSLGATAARR